LVSIPFGAINSDKEGKMVVADIKFQFLLVRLIADLADDIIEIYYVSIPFGAINSSGGRRCSCVLLVSIPFGAINSVVQIFFCYPIACFNSFWCD